VYLSVITRRFSLNLRINYQQDASSIQNFIFVTKRVEFRDKNKILGTCCVLLIIYTKIITMHGHLNIKFTLNIIWKPCRSACFFSIINFGQMPIAGLLQVIRSHCLPCPFRVECAIIVTLFDVIQL
jgi:hypothetical protein